MINDYIAEKVLMSDEVIGSSMGEQTKMLRFFENVLIAIKEEKPYATLSELLSADSSGTDIF